MEIKVNAQGFLIYAAMAGYLMAFMVTIVRYKKVGHFLYLLSFMIAVTAFIYRWFNVRHVPLQNLFEVFLCMGMIYPLTLFCRRVLGIGGETADMLLGAIVLFPAGFIFNDQLRHLPPALQSWLFAPHVAVYVIAYLLLAKATFQALGELLIKTGPSDTHLVSYEQGTYRMVCFGFPLLTLGLILGSVWGKLAWGDYWNWDPKELCSLASWLVFLGYFHFRYMFGKKHPHINSIWVIGGMLMVVITLLWANLSRLFAGLHSYAS